jgi:hypothetical protein
MNLRTSDSLQLRIFPEMSICVLYICHLTKAHSHRVADIYTGVISQTVTIIPKRDLQQIEFQQNVTCQRLYVRVRRQE